MNCLLAGRLAYARLALTVQDHLPRGWCCLQRFGWSCIYQLEKQSPADTPTGQSCLDNFSSDIFLPDVVSGQVSCSVFFLSKLKPASITEQVDLEIQSPFCLHCFHLRITCPSSRWQKIISFYIYNLEDKAGQQTVIPVTKTFLGLLQARNYMSSGLNR